MRAPALAPAPLVAALGLVAVLTAGCGHPMTKEECGELIDKLVELELADQKISDPAAVAQRKADVRQQKAPELEAKCQGRRMTDAAMACIRSARSRDDINDRCLR